MTRLRQLRLARGWSMDELLARAGKPVSKTALGNYENGEGYPPPKAEAAFARALGVKASELMSEPAIRMDFMGYRCTPKMAQTHRAQVEAWVEGQMDRRWRMAELVGHTKLPFTPKKAKVTDGDSAELAASALRSEWKLGTDPLTSPVACVEAKGVHVLVNDELPSECFTGLSGVARKFSASGEQKVCAVVAICRTDQCGERQGLTIIHEVGHVYCDVPGSISAKDEERLMYRFAGAVHAPAEAIRHAFGKERRSISLEELRIHKRVFRLSIGALIYRLLDVGVITKNAGGGLFGLLKKMGWDKKEPDEIEPEHPAWLRATALRLWNEGSISRSEAERAAGQLPTDVSESLLESRRFLRLPIAERRKLLEEAADRSSKYYADAISRGDVDSSACNE